MKASKLLPIGLGMTLASVALACDGSTRVSGGNGAMDASSDASQGSGGSGGEAAEGAAGGSNVSCNTAPCEGFEYAGMVRSTCCVDTTICGVDLGGACVAREALVEREAGGFGTGEPVVDDPSCPSFTFGMDGGVELTGCCDVSGVCGVSTVPLASAGTFPIPPMCITPDEAQGFGQGVADAGEQPCEYPADAGAGSPDGG